MDIVCTAANSRTLLNTGAVEHPYKCSLKNDHNFYRQGKKESMDGWGSKWGQKRDKHAFNNK